MAFNKDYFNCIANGSMGNTFTYHTSDNVVTPCLVSSSTAVSTAYFNSDLVANLAVNDRIFCSHSGSTSVSQLLQIVITAIKNSGVSIVFSA